MSRSRRSAKLAAGLAGVAGADAPLVEERRLSGLARPRFARALQHKISVGTVEPPSVSLLKLLLNPSVAVLTLLLCALAYGQPLSAPYIGLAVATLIVGCQVFDEARLNHPGGRHSAGFAWYGIFVDWAFVVAVLLLLGFATKVSAVFSRKVILTWLAVTPMALLVAQELARWALRRLASNGSVVRTQIIVGANEVGRELARKLDEDPCLGIVKGFFDDRAPGRLEVVRHERLLGTLKDLPDYVRRNGVNVIYISLPIAAEPRIVRLLEELRDTTASIYFVPDIFIFDLIQARFVDINGIPVVAVCETPFCGMDGVFKRVSDIVLAGLILLLIWPVMLAIAIGVKLSSPGPVLFKQRRYGLDGEEILVYKFRTMTVCEDGDRVEQARKNDRRVTPFGSFLRRTSLDELPQFINVLQGRMSVVGPRPHAVAHNEQYRKIINGYMLRHKVRPGITGWAQVNGLRGETETLDKMKKRVEYDLDYLRNWSLWLDLSIVFKTVGVVLRDRNAY